MLNYVTLFLILLSAAFSAETDSLFDCMTKGGILNCNDAGLSVQPKLGDSVNRTEQIILDNNIIKKIRVFETSISTYNISFRHNMIYTIEVQAFENLLNLTYLDLSHNLLTSEILRPKTFKGSEMSSAFAILPLKVLNLGSNSLHTLHPDLFEFLPELEELYLNSNPLKMLDHATQVALSSIHKVQVLDLSSTQLSDIPPYWLNALKNLNVINLSMNNLVNVPASLEEARGLRHLILDSNPIVTISSFPKLPTVQILNLSWMKNLKVIQAHSLVNLPGLNELYISNNHYLFQISEDALIEPGSYEEGKREGAFFPPIKKLDLSNNRLQYLREKMLDRWDNLEELKLDSNPWICDCENQWLVSELIPTMNTKNIGATKSLICGSPIEMKGKLMTDLYALNYRMRCLDAYGNQPDKDAKVLIIVLVAILVAIPVSLLFLRLIRRPRNTVGYRSAHYQRTNSLETMVSMLKLKLGSYDM